MSTLSKRKTAYDREAAAQALHQIHETLGGRCARCGFGDYRALQIDHVDGGGVDEIRKSGNKRWYYRKVLKSIRAGESRYQLLCANCNWIKRFRKAESPPRLIPEQRSLRFPTHSANAKLAEHKPPG